MSLAFARTNWSALDLVVGLQGTGDGKDLPLSAQSLKNTAIGFGCQC